MLTTERLVLEPLTIVDAGFILELVNTKGWLKFIGDRNVTSPTEATVYIQKILDNPDIRYWVVKLKESYEPVGIVTFIKRDYLDYHDIGFALLPRYCNAGYAYEATRAVLQEVTAQLHSSRILATTVPENISSVKLLTKLGFSFEKEIEIERTPLHVFVKMFLNGTEKS